MSTELWNNGIRDDSNNPALDVGNIIVVDLPGVDMTFAILLLVLRMYFVTILTICFHDGGNDGRSV